jgi:hypothetical protein
MLLLSRSTIFSFPVAISSLFTMASMLQQAHSLYAPLSHVSTCQPLASRTPTSFMRYGSGLVFVRTPQHPFDARRPQGIGYGHRQRSSEAWLVLREDSEAFRYPLFGRFVNSGQQPNTRLFPCEEAD